MIQNVVLKITKLTNNRIEEVMLRIKPEEVKVEEDEEEYEDY